jgi:long-chain acyl-CoA synthetase
MNQAIEPTTVPGFIRNVVANIHPDSHTFLMHKVKDVWVEITYKQALEKIDAISAWFLRPAFPAY